MKFLHGWLATNAKQKTVGWHRDDKCVLCGEEETSFHIFYCKNQEFARRRKQLWSDAQKKLKTMISEEGLAALNIGITQDRLEGEEHDSYQFITNPKTREVYRSQYQIGWRQIYLGRFHKQWKGTMKVNKEGHNSPYLKTVIGTMWSFGLQLWQQRNIQNHGEKGEISGNTTEKMLYLVDEVTKVLHRDIEYDRRWIS